MKQQLLDTLFYIIASSTSIKLHIDKIAEIREQLEMLDDYTNIEKIGISSVIKDRVQSEAGIAIGNEDRGLILMATGTGKSKIVIDRIARSYHLGARKFLIVVPTIRLRDVTWREEFIKWNKLDIYTNVQMICYDSLHTIEGEYFFGVYLDEGHHITPASAVFFKNNTISSCIALTATAPTSREKQDIFKSLNMYPIYELTLDEGIKLGIIAPYDITIITTKLDNKHKYLKAGSKTKSWLQTEQSAYNYITNRIGSMEEARKMDRITRMRLIYNFKTKMFAAKYIIQELISDISRTIIFAGSIEHAIELCPYRYHSKPTLSKTASEDRQILVRRILENYRGDADLKRFENEEINQISCVESLNEGQNIKNLDIAFIVQLNAQKLDFIQRIGRILRFRPGHTGKIIILALEDTVDAEWVKRATSDLNAARINTIKLEDLQSGKETISFN